MSGSRSSERIARGLVGGAALAVLAVALVAIFVRVAGQWSPWVADFKPHLIIALHNAFCFLLMGAALFVHNRWPRRRGSRVFTGLVVVVVSGVALVVLARSLFPVRIDFETWIARLASPAANARVGQMSLHTAITHLCVIGALGLLANGPQGRRWVRPVAFILAALAFGSGLFAALGFAMGAPLNPDSRLTAMMWLSASLFVALASGMMLAVFPNNWLLQGLTGETGEPADTHSLRFRRALVLMLLFLTGGIVTAGFYFLRKERSNLRERVEQELAAVVNLKAAQIADWQRERLKEANLMLHTPYAARRALNALAQPASQQTREMFTGWLGPFLATGPYAEALVLEPKLGVALVHPPGGPKELSAVELNAAEASLLTRRPVVTDLHRIPNHETIYLSLLVPIIVRKDGNREIVPPAGASPSPNDRSAAVLLLRMDATQTLFPLVRTWPAASRTAEAMLVRREQSDCLCLSELRYRSNAALRLRLPLTQTNAPAVMAALGLETVVRGTDYRDVPVLAVTRKVPRTPWALVAKVDEEEVYAPVKERGWALSSILGALLAAVTLSLNLLWRQRDVEYLRRQVAAEKEKFALAQRLAYVMKHANDIIIMTDDQWRILEVNDRALEVYGYTPAEIHLLHAPDLRAPAARADFPALAEQFRTQGQVVVETIHQRKDGSTFPVEVSTRRVAIDGVIHSLAVIRDITERKRAEEAVRQSEEKYRVLFDGAAEGVAVADQETKTIQYANPAFCAMFGYGNDELMNLPLATLHPAESFAQVAAGFQAQARGEKSLVDDLPCRRKNGTMFFAEVRAKPAVIAGRPVLVGFFTDITERKQAGEALRASEERFRMLAESSLAGIYLFHNNRFIYVNPAFARIFGYEPAELIGHLGPQDLTHPEDRALVAENIRRRTENNEPQVRYEFRGLRRDQTLVRVEALGARIDYHGQPAILGTLLDITEKKQLEAQFLRAQRMEGIGALAGGVAHDLNNILAPILMSTSLLRETVTDPESRSMLATMQACAQRGADIIKQLLTFARGRPGARVPLPVRHLMRDMEKIIRETFPRNIQPVIQAPKDLWPVLGDATQIHQALMNLCVNARDAMPDGGRLTVTACNVTLDENAAAAIPDAKAGCYVGVSVTDTGCGISPEHLERIFDPFFTTKDIGKGTGLGLPTVLGIVRGHDGFVRVNSLPGNGTTMEIFLRASPEASLPIESEAEAPPPRGHGELILVVDDEAGVRSSLQRTLAMHGYRVLTATEGNAALALFARHSAEIQAVLTDMMMPGMEGPALIRSLRYLSPRLPILGMTGLAHRGDVKGVDGLDLPIVLNKPFSSAKLLSVLHKTLAAHSVSDSALAEHAA